MTTKFISVVTDEAMQKICYTGGGWQLSPYQFSISKTDILAGIQVVDEQGNPTEEAMDRLKTYTTSDMQADTDNVWCGPLPFSSIEKANNDKNADGTYRDNSVLNHHIVIPPNLDVTTTEDIKTIYFLYKAEDGEIFLYAIAYAVEDMKYEVGVTQSLFFNFTVANARTVADVDFVVNYLYPSEINDHNFDENAHDILTHQLVDRAGTKTITGTLMYSGDRTFTSDYQLVSKAYVDALIAQLKADNNLR